METNDKARCTVKIAIRCLKETKCYLEYLKEIKIDKDRWTNLISYLEFLSSLSSDRREYALKELIVRTIVFFKSTKGATYWVLKNSEFERKYNSIANLYYYGMELEDYADLWFTKYNSSPWMDGEWETIVPSYTTSQNRTILVGQ